MRCDGCSLVPNGDSASATAGGHGADGKILEAKDSTAVGANSCWAGLNWYLEEDMANWDWKHQTLVEFS